MKINQITEDLKNPKDNPCWKDYHPVGTKQKAGRTVPNCVPNANEGVAEGSERDKHYYLRNDIWRVMDGDELVDEYRPDRYEIVGAKKLLAQFDDEGYDVTHVISPMGTVTYLYGKPEDNMDESVVEGSERAVDAKGRTQQRWMQMVRQQFPDARIIQSKMIDGPVQAILPDGRKLAWSKAESGATARNFSNEEQARGSAIDPDTKCKTCGTPYRNHFRFDENGKILSSLVRHPQMKDDFPGKDGMSFNKPGTQPTGGSPRPSIPSKRLELGDIIGYSNSRVLNKSSKIIKAEVLVLGGTIGRSAVGVKLLDPEAIAANGGDPTAVISIFDVRQNPYGGESVSEDFDSIPDSLQDLDAFKKLPAIDQFYLLQNAGLISKRLNFYSNPVKDLDFVGIYKKAKHDRDLTNSDRENELNIGSEGRTELKRKADELAEIKREKLRNERLHDEEVAFQRAETVQQRQDEMKKIADQYKHDLTVIDKEHSNNMEAIKTNNKFELEKLDKEYNDNQRERDFKSGESDKEFRDRNKDRDFRAGESDKEFRDRNQDREFRSGESDKDYADRQREREHQQSMADKEREQSRPEPEQEPRQRTKPQRPRPQKGDNYDQDTGEPLKPGSTKPQQSSPWHTSQQLGYTPSKPNDDDITDVEPKKPPALGNSVKEALQRMTQLAGLTK
jgi:hypothetical protein